MKKLKIDTVTQQSLIKKHSTLSKNPSIANLNMIKLRIAEPRTDEERQRESAETHIRNTKSKLYQNMEEIKELQQKATPDNPHTEEIKKLQDENKERTQGLQKLLSRTDLPKLEKETKQRMKKYPHFYESPDYKIDKQQGELYDHYEKLKQTQKSTLPPEEKQKEISKINTDINESKQKLQTHKNNKEQSDTKFSEQQELKNSEEWLQDAEQEIKRIQDSKRIKPENKKEKIEEQNRKIEKHKDRIKEIKKRHQEEEQKKAPWYKKLFTK